MVVWDRLVSCSAALIRTLGSLCKMMSRARVRESLGIKDGAGKGKEVKQEFAQTVFS